MSPDERDRLAEALTAALFAADPGLKDAMQKAMDEGSADDVVNLLAKSPALRSLVARAEQAVEKARRERGKN